MCSIENVSKSVISETKYEIEWRGKFEVNLIYICVASGEIISQSKLADSIFCVD